MGGVIEMPQRLFRLVQHPQQNPAGGKIGFHFVGNGLGGMAGRNFVSKLRLVHIQQFAGDQAPLGPEQSALAGLQTMRNLDEQLRCLGDPVAAAQIFDAHEQGGQFMGDFRGEGRKQFVA